MKKYKLNEKYHNKLIERTKEVGLYGMKDIVMISKGRYNEYQRIYMNLLEEQRHEEIENKYNNINELKDLIMLSRNEDLPTGIGLDFINYLNEIEDNKNYAIAMAYAYGKIVGKEWN